MNLEVVSARPGYFTASIAAIEVMQMIIQAVWHRELHDKTELMQLPHMDNEQVLGYCLEKKKEKERVKSVRRMLERPEADRRCVSPPPPSLKARKRREGRGGALASDAQGSPRLCCNRRRGVRPRRGPYSIISALLRLLDDNQYQAMLDTASKIPVLDIVKCKAFGRCQTARPTRRRGRGGRDGTTAAFASYG